MAIFNENVSGKMMEDDQLDSRLPHSWPMGKGCELCWPSEPACFAAWMPFLLRQIVDCNLYEGGVATAASAKND